MHHKNLIKRSPSSGTYFKFKDMKSPSHFGCVFLERDIRRVE